MKTISAKAEAVKRDWYVVDASGKTLGRLCTELARRLRGKHKPIYTPHVDTGDYLVVINAEKIAVTGKKLDDKIYHRFTGYVGNLKTTSLKDMLAQHPERVIEIAVKGMLPKNPLGRAMYRKLKVYTGPTIRIPPSSRRCWTSNKEQNHGIAAELRHRPSQVLHRPRVPAHGQRQHRRQRQAARRVLRPRDLAHDRAPAARADQEPPTSSTSWSRSKAAASPARPARSASASPARWSSTTKR